MFAAASLTEALSEMGEEFHAENPAVSVTFTFAGSSSLARQLEEGARADIFASADERTMAEAVAAGTASRAQVMARNHLALVVERGNPKGVRGLSDLSRRDVLFVACAPQVPCGALAAAALQQAGVGAQARSQEENVKAVVARVTLGEADAGIVYATDVIAAGDRAEGVDIAPAGGPALETEYMIAETANPGNPGAARAWVDFVLSDRGRAILGRFGFLPA